MVGSHSKKIKKTSFSNLFVLIFEVLIKAFQWLLRNAHMIAYYIGKCRLNGKLFHESTLLTNLLLYLCCSYHPRLISATKCKYNNLINEYV